VDTIVTSLFIFVIEPFQIDIGTDLHKTIKLNLINIYKMSAYALKLNDIEFGSLFSL